MDSTGPILTSRTLLLLTGVEPEAHLAYNCTSNRWFYRQGASQSINRIRRTLILSTGVEPELNLNLIDTDRARAKYNVIGRCINHYNFACFVNIEYCSLNFNYKTQRFLQFMQIPAIYISVENMQDYCCFWKSTYYIYVICNICN